MTPTAMKRIGYTLIAILVIIVIYPYIENSLYSSKFTEIAILGPTGIIGDYSPQIQLGKVVPLNIYLENHEKEIKLYKVLIKLVENSTLNNSSPPFLVDPVSSYLTVLQNNENTTYPVEVVFNQPFSGKIVAELYMYDATASKYIYHDRWVAIWMKTIK